MDKATLIRYNQARHINDERRLLERLDHPFIISLVRNFIILERFQSAS